MFFYLFYSFRFFSIKRKNFPFASSLKYCHLISFMIFQVFFVAGIHGDEVVGPNAVISFAKYLLENYQRNETLKNYIQNRMIICFPMSTPVGFYHNQRVNKQFFGFSLKITIFFFKNYYFKKKIARKTKKWIKL